jgi:radical SAM superfamily enzyme YgiQ (UPF0313 family)
VKVRFVYPRFQRHAQAHPELLDCVPCNEYFGPPSLGIACLAAVTPSHWQIDFRDDRVEDVGLDDELDLVAISTFTPSAKRALELADAFRARGRKVILGGIFPTMMPELASQHADSVVMGEGDGIWPEILSDVENGTLRRFYRESTPFDLSTAPLPRVDLYLSKEGSRYRPDDYPVQVSRGCPLSCSACALPESMGKKLRPYPIEHVVGQIEQLASRGKLASLTEDTSLFLFSGMQRKFAEIMDRMADRPGGSSLSYLGISMPMILAAPAAMLDRIRRAGVNMFYLVGGFDPVSIHAFTGENPGAYQRAVDSIAKAFDHGIEPYTSFLVGNDEDNEGTFDRMLSFAEKTGLRKAEFAILTPYPGTPVWRRLSAENRIFDYDWSHYNDANVVFRPKQMTEKRLLEGYLYLWREFYRPRQTLREGSYIERTIQF